MSLDDRPASAPQLRGCDPNLTALREALQVARLFIITAHDAEQAYVKSILSRVDAALAKSG